MKPTLLFVLAITLLSCSESKKMSSSKAIPLFDGKTFNGWHGFNKTGTIKTGQSKMARSSASAQQQIPMATTSLPMRNMTTSNSPGTGK